MFYNKENKKANKAKPKKQTLKIKKKTFLFVLANATNHIAQENPQDKKLFLFVFANATNHITHIEFFLSIHALRTSFSSHHTTTNKVIVGSRKALNNKFTCVETRGIFCGLGALVIENFPDVPVHMCIANRIHGRTSRVFWCWWWCVTMCVVGAAAGVCDGGDDGLCVLVLVVCV
jgi:hypothetical protein